MVSTSQGMSVVRWIIWVLVGVEQVVGDGCGWVKMVRDWVCRDSWMEWVGVGWRSQGVVSG